MESLYYPAGPVNVAASVTEPSAAFKREVTRVMGSIGLFFVVYLLLMVLATALAVACEYGGFVLIMTLSGFLAIMFGIGLIGLGVMVLFFLVKFIFAVSRFDRSGSVEITEGEQPRLFAFIRQLTQETQTAFPKHIYLSPEVNACVFYDSGFRSMFLPVKKNLQIGLGLVNAVNVSEFKAVMAHEFGHFSQRSMRLGSFVYNVNRVIYNMLYENKSYGAFLTRWARISNYFALFANITVRIVQGIQWVLRKMYGFINKSYMRLSREMEFHADAVAASVSGSNNCISALRRVELAGACYQTVLQKCGDWLREKYVSRNVYDHHHTVLRQYAREFRLELQQGLPVVNREFLQSNRQSRINFKDQWASHPALGEREQQLNALQLEAPGDIQSAWVLFDQVSQLKEALTQKVYQNLPPGEELQTLDPAVFENRYQQEVQQYSLPEAYGGFYEGRQIPIMDVHTILSGPVPGNTPASEAFQRLFSPEHMALPKAIQSLDADIELLHAIIQKQVAVRSFDFDGNKYESNQAPGLLGQLESERKEKAEALAALDLEIARFFCRYAWQRDASAAQELGEWYRAYFDLRKEAGLFFDRIRVMMENLQPLFSGATLTIEQVRPMIRQLKNSDEPSFKEKLRYLNLRGLFDQQPEIKEKVDQFLGSDYQYFSGSEFFSNELKQLNELANASWRLLQERLFTRFKELLVFQLTLVDI